MKVIYSNTPHSPVYIRCDQCPTRESLSEVKQVENIKEALIFIENIVDIGVMFHRWPSLDCPHIQKEILAL